MTRAAIVRHVAFEDAGLIAPLLHRRGITLNHYDAATDDLTAIAGADLLIVLGGPISANDTQDYPFLDAEIALLRERLQADRPTLGLCLGAQLMARALGAAVHSAGAKEIGWAPVMLTEAGADLLAPLENVPVLHWHGEIFDLPAGAASLARTDITPHQGFAFRKRALALQFHPEVTAAGLEHWFVGHTGEIAATPGIDVPSLRAATRRHAPYMETAGSQLFDDWLDRVLT